MNPSRCMSAHAYKLQTSAMCNAELKAFCQPSGEVLSSKPAAYKSPFLAYLAVANAANALYCPVELPSPFGYTPALDYFC